MMLDMRTLGFLIIASLASASAFCADWSPRLAAKYLDSRQKDWFAWPTAKATSGPCISCHTGVTYLLARPALRETLGESGPTAYETGLRDALLARSGSVNPMDMFPAFGKGPNASQALGVETVLAALFLSSGEDSPDLDADGRRAFDRLWAHQIQDGPAKGAWEWFNLALDPYEMPPSPFYGATFAAMAVGSAPAAYRKDPNVRQHVAQLNEYFAREWRSQPLHNRLMLVWASTKLPSSLAPTTRKAALDETLHKQNADGGWSIESLGPWKEHPGAPASTGSNSYATAFATFVLSTAGVPSSSPSITKAVAWLASHQDQQTGFWVAESMNKKYDAGSMPEGFMRDAATAFAVMALTQAGGR